MLFNLRRITSTGKWLPQIDGLRFIAISSVLFSHILAETYHRTESLFRSDRLRDVVNSFDSRGSRGVSLFFAISGFILAQPFLRQHLLKDKPVSISGYFKRRLTRLEPPYILSLLIYAFALVMIHAPVSTRGLMAQMVYLHNWTKLPSVSFVTWSLEVEVQFYILAPLLGYLYAIQSVVVRRAVIIGLTLGSLCTAVLVPDSKLSWNLPGQLQFFMVGFFLADVRATRLEPSVRPWWDVVGTVAMVEMFVLPFQHSIWVLPVLIFLVCLSAFNGPIIRRVLSTNWIALTGGMCYSFYLMHMLVISTAFRVTRRLVYPSNFWLTVSVQMVILGACIYAFCAAYYILIERPCMDPSWPRKALARIRKERLVRS